MGFLLTYQKPVVGMDVVAWVYNPNYAKGSLRLTPCRGLGQNLLAD
jgi:hypothetical protein